MSALTSTTETSISPWRVRPGVYLLLLCTLLLSGCSRNAAEAGQPVCFRHRQAGPAARPHRGSVEPYGDCRKRRQARGARAWGAASSRSRRRRARSAGSTKSPFATQDTFDAFDKLAKDHADDPAVASGVVRDEVYMHLKPGRETERFYRLSEGDKLKLIARATLPKALPPGNVGDPGDAACRHDRLGAFIGKGGQAICLAASRPRPSPSHGGLVARA